jgi:flagellar basal-body rod modification protein FlgD
VPDTSPLAAIDPNGALGYLVNKPKTTAPDNAMGKDAFLKLLVAQMKYQDPMNPAQGSDFVAQTAQFTMVEAIEKLSDQNAEMLSSQKSLSASAFVGREIKWQPPSTDGTGTLPPLEKGVVSGMKLTSDGPILLVGTKEITLADVREVHTAPVVVPIVPPVVPTDGTDPTDDTTDDATPPTDGTSTDDTAAPAA